MLTLKGSFPYVTSGHPTGANFGFCDGAVRFLTSTIDGTVYSKIITPAGSKLPLPTSNCPSARTRSSSKLAETETIAATTGIQETRSEPAPRARPGGFFICPGMKMAREEDDGLLATGHYNHSPFLELICVHLHSSADNTTEHRVGLP